MFEPRVDVKNRRHRLLYAQSKNVFRIRMMCACVCVLLHDRIEISELINDYRCNRALYEIPKTRCTEHINRIHNYYYERRRRMIICIRNTYLQWFFFRRVIIIIILMRFDWKIIIKTIVCPLRRNTCLHKRTSTRNLYSI